jgi:Tol biopolymer transport system component
VLENVQWAEWSPRGDLAVVRRGEQAAQLEYPIGKVLVKTGGMIQCPRFSASGEEIAYLSYPRLTDTAGSVEMVDLAGNRKTLTEKWPNVWGLAWHPRTREVWFSAGKTGAKFDLYAVTREGAVRPVLLQMSNGVIQDIAQDGRVLLTALNQQMRMRYVDDGRKVERDLSWLDWSMVHAISADGDKVVFAESGEGSGETFVTYFRKTDGSPAVRLGEGGFPDLSPDGRQVAVAKQEADGIVLWPVGAGEAKRIPLPGFHVNFVHWRAGTRSLLFSGTEGGKGLRIWEVSADAPGAPRPLTPEGMVPMFGVSRDGRYFAAAEARTQQLLVYPLDGGEPVTVSAYEAGEVPMAMTGDGSSVLVVQRGMLPARVMKLDWRMGKRELWREIQPPDRAGVLGLMIFAVTPDLRQYTYSYLQQLSDLHLVAGLR